MRESPFELVGQRPRLDVLTAALASDVEFVAERTSRVALDTAALAIAASKALGRHTAQATDTLDEVASHAMEIM